MEQTLILFKPDSIQRRLVGPILDRYEKKGLQICAVKLLNVSQNMAEKLYLEHKNKPFFIDLVKYITSAPIIAMVMKAPDAILIARTLNGATNARDALPGSIRGDFALSQRFNLVHASDSVESAKREIPIFFNDNEILIYEMNLKDWISPGN
ncbi:MAG: nucleoside-diphosphate kinase [Candidatus Aureabacteria bacterium]|nr:nucleoside-diphosphate kinase [Candidatus Auribacterota bacterium]